MIGKNKTNCVLVWKRFLTYAAAAKLENVVYLFEWNGIAHYIGIATDFQERYRYGYRHLIEGILQNGGRLYIATYNIRCGREIIESELIRKLKPSQNKRVKSNKSKSILNISHEGNVPESILNSGVY